MTPIPPPALTPEQQEEARRQAEAQAGTPVADALDGASQAVDLAADGTLGAVMDAAGTALGATLDVAKAGIEGIGELFGALSGL